MGHALPALHSFLQFLQEIPVELIQLRQVVQDLVKEPVLNHGLPELPGRMGYGTPEILLQSGGQKSLFARDRRQAQEVPSRTHSPPTLFIDSVWQGGPNNIVSPPPG